MYVGYVDWLIENNSGIIDKNSKLIIKFLSIKDSMNHLIKLFKIDMQFLQFIMDYIDYW